MSKEIQSGKSSDFQNAVYSLVGLTATQNTIEHLKSNKKCVVKEIQREIDNNSKSAEKMEQKNTQITELDEKIQNNTTELEKLQQARTRMEEKRRSNNRLIIDGQKDMQVKKSMLHLRRTLQIWRGRRTRRPKICFR